MRRAEAPTALAREGYAERLSPPTRERDFSIYLGMFTALKGNGATARLIMLPNESHWYRARESVMHTLAEMVEWFDKYVKNAEPRRITF